MCRPDPCGSGTSNTGWTKATSLAFFKKSVQIIKINNFILLANVKNLKIIRDKIKHTNLGYGFIEFDTSEIAREVIEALNGKPIPDTNRYIF